MRSFYEVWCGGDFKEANLTRIRVFMGKILGTVVASFEGVFIPPEDGRVRGIVWGGEAGLTSTFPCILISLPPDCEGRK